MGGFVIKGDKIWEWRYGLDGSQLYHMKGACMDVYAPPPRAGEAKQPNRWTRVDIDLPRCKVGSICTVKDIPGNEKATICYADGPQMAPHPLTFWEVLCKWQRTWMWDNLQWVGDDDWIANTIAKGTCMAVTYGSYMKDLYPHIYSAMVVLECMKGRGRVWCSFSEASQVACSYCGELIGLMAISDPPCNKQG
jgi:hypothetical protein